MFCVTLCVARGDLCGRRAGRSVVFPVVQLLGERERANWVPAIFMGPHLPHATHTAVHSSLMTT